MVLPMINPTTITNFNRTEEELEEFLMFAILVAGKTAKTQAEKLNKFLERSMHENSGKPFQHIQHLLGWGWLDLRMREFKLGQYKRIGHAFTEILKFKGRLKSVTLEELESIKGIGSKTARFFLLHSRKDAKYAVLDTHILKWLREQGYDAPKATPTKKKYAVLEKIFLTEAWKREMNPADLDLEIWKSYATPDL
jgi:thermostable 8-oxoguanine DNA glycosylase